METTYRAGGGVVLAAGAFGSPHLLTLSGIGPADELSRLGPPVRADAPEVGHNLQDHPLVPVVVEARGVHGDHAPAPTWNCCSRRSSGATRASNRLAFTP